LPDKAEASFENGVLILTIPKAEEVKPKTIKVKAKK
jgi:HSP20 family protein